MLGESRLGREESMGESWRVKGEAWRVRGEAPRVNEDRLGTIGNMTGVSDHARLGLLLLVSTCLTGGSPAAS